VFLTSAEAAALLRVSKRTLERMRVEGTGPRYLKVGPGKRSRVLYREADILAWLEGLSYTSTSEYTTQRRQPGALPPDPRDIYRR
jgi:hypothetical protein